MDEANNVHDFSNCGDKDTLGSVLAVKPPETDHRLDGETDDTLGRAMSRSIAGSTAPVAVTWWRDNPHFSH